MTIRENLEEAGWNFDHSYAHLPEIFFEEIDPNPVDAPKLIIFNDALAATLGLNVNVLKSEASIAIFAGNKVPDGALPLAQAYAGHQFGHFTMLGDGRAMLIGEQITPAGERFDIQLKGSGPTPYSRRGDGRAALGPMLREYIVSEAMYALGIPTTRSLAVVTTGEPIMRETMLPGAILTRISSSHLRFGTFEYAAKSGTVEELQALADYAIDRHYPEINTDENQYVSLLEKVIERHASLVAQWQLVGFVHGVMNTDNMTISGETIDYGPCAFIDVYNPTTVFSSIDIQGRYAYGNQPSIVQWNLARFAETILPLLHEDASEAMRLAQDVLLEFPEQYELNWLSGMSGKLGLFDEEKEDKSLIHELLKIMDKYQVDYTNTFLALTFNQLEGARLFESSEFREWHKLWQERLSRQGETQEATHQLMRDRNPAVIPRNHHVEAALEAAVEGDTSVMEKLLNALANPYAHTAEQKNYTTSPESDSPFQTFCGT